MKLISAAIFLAGLQVFTACGQQEDSLMSSPDESQENEGLYARGNGAPAGKHFQLNIIGVPKTKTAEITSGNRIFVALEGRTKVLLSQGEFAVLDANGTDGSASFRLPSPDPDGDGVTSYSVFARPLGTPGGTAKLNTCATDPVTLEEVCSLETFVTTRSTGRSTFTNVSSQLLSISADVDGDGVVERVPLFDARLQNYLWNYDNAGLKVLQLRFHEVPSSL